MGLIKTIKCSQLFEINFESVWRVGIKRKALWWGEHPKGGAAGSKPRARVLCSVFGSSLRDRRGQNEIVKFLWAETAKSKELCIHALPLGSTLGSAFSDARE